MFALNIFQVNIKTTITTHYYNHNNSEPIWPSFK